MFRGAVRMGASLLLTLGLPAALGAARVVLFGGCTSSPCVCVSYGCFSVRVALPAALEARTRDGV